jgi:hypothetical protein
MWLTRRVALPVEQKKINGITVQPRAEKYSASLRTQITGSL